MPKPTATKTILLAVIAVAGALVLSGCFGSEKEKRGLRYMPDMYESPALKSTETMTVIDYDDEGNIVQIREVPGLLPPPSGARARNLPYTAPAGAWESEEHAKYANPLALDAHALRLGRIKYENYCAVCHGRDGNVDNNYLGDKFSAIPSLNNDIMAEKTDGHIYDVITHGIRRMPNYRPNYSLMSAGRSYITCAYCKVSLSWMMRPKKPSLMKNVMGNSMNLPHHPNQYLNINKVHGRS